MQPLLSVSVVSHSQGRLVANLLSDIESYCKGSDIEVILTLNLPEDLPFLSGDYDFPLTVIKNSSPLGFGANHNQAFLQAKGDFFCVLNPDIRLNQNPFPELLTTLDSKKIGVIAPHVVNSAGGSEDSARYFPSPLEILRKLCGGRSAAYIPTSLESVSFPDWVAGMFMLFRSEVYRDLGGFNTKYFMYYEDVELCARLTLMGYHVAVCQNIAVVHDGQRSSHRSLIYLKWHLMSMMRFFLTPQYWGLRRRARAGIK